MAGITICFGGLTIGGVALDGTHLTTGIILIGETIFTTHTIIGDGIHRIMVMDGIIRTTIGMVTIIFPGIDIDLTTLDHTLKIKDTGATTIHTDKTILLIQDTQTQVIDRTEETIQEQTTAIVVILQPIEEVTQTVIIRVNQKEVTHQQLVTELIQKVLTHLQKQAIVVVKVHQPVLLAAIATEDVKI